MSAAVSNGLERGVENREGDAAATSAFDEDGIAKAAAAIARARAVVGEADVSGEGLFLGW